MVNFKLKELSPKLFGTVQKTFPEFIEPCELAFRISIRHRGDKELSFNRPEGVTFNPRLARIPIIVSDYLKYKTIDQIITSILSSAIYSSTALDKFLREIEENFTEKIIKNINEIVIFESNPKNLESAIVNLSKECRVIILSNFIDRCRHAHLSGDQEIEKCLSLYPTYYSLIPIELQEIASTLNTWHNRASQKKAKSIKNET